MSDIQAQNKRRTDYRAIGLVLGVAALARFSLLAYRLLVLDIPANRLVGSDVAGWLGIARHLAGKGDLSYWFLGARPPLFPLTVAAVYKLGGTDLHAAILQTMFGTLAAPLGYLLIRRLLSAIDDFSQADRYALLGGLIVALDPASIFTSAVLLSDPLFNMTFNAMLLSLTVYIQERRARALFFAALWMALGMLTRPTTLYFWVVAPLIFAPLLRRWWRPALALGLVGLPVYVGWSLRNLRYDGVFTYSLQANYHLLYYRAVSAEHLATGADVDSLYTQYAQEVYRDIGEFELAESAHEDTFFLMIVADSPAEYEAMGRLARQKLLRYWWGALLGTGVGLFRMYAFTAPVPWSYPPELIYHTLLYGLALLGAWRAYKAKEWALLLITGVPVLYMTGITLISQTSGMSTRMRTPLTALIAALAMVGLERVWAARSRRNSP